jgi:hypothetical protein
MLTKHIVSHDNVTTNQPHTHASYILLNLLLPCFGNPKPFNIFIRGHISDNTERTDIGDTNEEGAEGRSFTTLRPVSDASGRGQPNK